MDVHGYTIVVSIVLIIVGSFYCGRSYELYRMNARIRSALKVVK